MRLRVPEKTWKSYQPIEVRGGVPLATVSYIAEHIEQFPGVTWRNKPIRNYLESGLARARHRLRG